MSVKQTKAYVVHKHLSQNQSSHYDLMLEKLRIIPRHHPYTQLETYRLNFLPEKARSKILAEKIFDHPPRFLAYQGPVQNNSGNVEIIDKGKYVTLHRSQFQEQLLFIKGLLAGRYILSWIKQNKYKLTKL